MNDPKRAEIKARIAAAQAREAERGERTLAQKAQEGAVDAKDRLTEFAKEHPVATVAGGLALGIVIASMFKGPRRAAVQTGTKAASIAALRDAGDAGRDGLRKLDDMGDAVGDTARTLRREAAYRAGHATDAARSVSRETGKTIARALSLDRK